MIDFRPGDIAACFGADSMSRCITKKTAWPLAPARLRMGPSHVAMLATFPRYGLLWAESTTLCREPCLIRGEKVRGVQAHLPDERIDDYAGYGGRVDVYRLAPFQTLSSSECELLTRIVRNAIRDRVDYEVPEAVLSATWFLRRIWWQPPSRTSTFCSKFLAAILARLGRLNHRHPAYYSPATLMRELVTTGVYEFVGEAAPSLRIFPQDDDREKLAA